MVEVVLSMSRGTWTMGKGTLSMGKGLVMEEGAEDMVERALAEERSILLAIGLW